MNKLEEFLNDLKEVIKRHDAEIIQSSSYVELSENEIYGFYVSIGGKSYSIGKEGVHEY